MDNIDGRKIPDPVREQIRIEAIENWLAGMTPTSLARKYGTSRKIVYQWIDRYKTGGWEGLKTRTGKTGPKPKLSPEQQERLRVLLRTQTPADYGYQTALWTCQIIADLVDQTFQTKYTAAHVGKLLKKMNFSPQKPRWGAWEQDEKKVNEWLNIRYPTILQQAEEQDAIIFFLDESTAKSESHRGRTWGIKGLTPVVKTTGSRRRLNLISVVSSEGIMRYKTFTGSMDRFAFVDYLKSLVRSVDKPIIVITDGHPAHRAKFTKEYVEQEPRLLGLHLLPGYSPELNPDEQVWNHLKEKLGKTALKTKEEFIEFIRSKMKSLQKMPEAVKGFFRLPDTSYACRKYHL